MWVAKIKFNSEGTLIGSVAKKYKIDIFGFPLSYSFEKEYALVQVAGKIIGTNEDKNKFLREMKIQKRVVNLESNDDFIIGTIQEPKYTNDLYKKEIFHLSPTFISSEGYEIIEIGSFERKDLTKIISLFEKKYGAKLLFLGERKIKNISIVKQNPDLTEKQKQAMNLAVKNGYYHSPRKISVESLAKLAKLSFSTFQVHLRKAEQRLIPFYFEKE